MKGLRLSLLVGFWGKYYVLFHKRQTSLCSRLVPEASNNKRSKNAVATIQGGMFAKSMNAGDRASCSRNLKQPERQKCLNANVSGKVAI